MIFANREQAGQLLAEELLRFRDKDPIVLALPRGGLPIGLEVAKALDAPLDILLVRKIGVPGSPELAAGAIVDGDTPELVLNKDIVKLYDIPERYLENRKKQQLVEIERRRALYLADRSPVSVEGKSAIIVDDGIATGSTVLAAVRALRRRNPARVLVAVPVGPADTIEKLEREADEVICLETPDPFFAIGSFYRDFAQLDDEDVISALQAAT